MAWSRAKFGQALFNVLSAAAQPAPPVLADNDDGDDEDYVTPPPAVYERPPASLNPPSVVVGRVVEVRYSEAAFGIDAAEFSVLAIGPADGDDIVDGLIQFIRDAIDPDPTLGGVVPSCICAGERNWRMARVTGIDVLVAEVFLSVQM